MTTAEGTRVRDGDLHVRRVLPFGDHGILIELDSLDEVMGLYAALHASRPAGVVDLVPAARTIGVIVDPARLPLSVAAVWAAETAPADLGGSGSQIIEIPVRYDGEDVDEVAAILGMTRAELVALHTASDWRVAFCGFAPGFAYLVTDHDRLRVPRRATPRPSVPAGAVGLAGEFSGVYPRSSPGGWQLIGSTDAAVWDASAEHPALLAPGVRVRFVERR